MSGVKRVVPNYEQLYQQEIQQRQQVESHNRELERKVREQEVIKNQIAQTEARLTKDFDTLKQSAQRTAQELVNVHQKQQQVIEQMSGVRIDIQVTNANLNKLHWETQENFARIGDSQQRLQAMVQTNHDLILQNRDQIIQNRVQIEQGFKLVDQQFEAVGLRLDAMEKKERFEKMRTAAQLIETSLLLRFNLSDETLRKFALERFEQASLLLKNAQQAFETDQFQTAIEMASVALTAMTETVNTARERQTQYQSQKNHVTDVYHRAYALLESMKRQSEDESEFNDVMLWNPTEYHQLHHRLEEISQLIEGESFDQALRHAQQTYDDVVRLQYTIEQSLNQQVARETLANTLVEAFTAYGPVKPSDIDFADINNPNSDIIIYTDGPEIHIPMSDQLEFRFELPHDPKRNGELVNQSEKVLQKQKIARRLNY